MRRYGCLLVAGLLGACGRDAPTAEAPNDQLVTAETAAHARLAIEDALVRIVPGLDDPARAGEIASALGDLAQALADAEYGKSATLARAAEQQLDQYQKAAGEDLADLDAIRLALAATTDAVR